MIGKSNKKMVLIGYMGSGKSTVAKLLSLELNMDMYDLDDYIEKEENMSITDIFKLKGEIYFRNREHFHLKNLLDSAQNVVLSVGGGTPCYSGNIDLINSKATSVFLKSSVQSLYNRLVKEKSKRPLISSVADNDLMEFIAKHLFERSAFYEKARIIVYTDDKSPEDIISELKKLI